MIGPRFIINKKNLDFYLNTKTKQWHIGKTYANPLLKLSKVKGDTVIMFLELLQEQHDSELEIKSDT